MKKQLLIFGIFATLMLGCQQSQILEKKPEVSLSSVELEGIQGNREEIKYNLVRKSVLREMFDEKYTEKEKSELENIKTEAEIEYFLNKKAMERIQVTDEKVLEFYQQNVEELKNFDINVALTLIKNEMINQQLYIEKINYVNSLMAKYEIEKKVNDYLAGDKKETTVTPEVKTEENTK